MKEISKLKFRVIVGMNVHPFDLYSKALEFKQKNGGTLYMQVW